MRRDLVYSGRFVRASKRLLKRDFSLAEALKVTLRRLAEDAFQTSLRSHKLKGELMGSWSCSGGFDLRVVFEVVTGENGEESILLQSVGTHEDVY